MEPGGIDWEGREEERKKKKKNKKKKKKKKKNETPHECKIFLKKIKS
jgi:hypothetical protein